MLASQDSCHSSSAAVGYSAVEAPAVANCSVQHSYSAAVAGTAADSAAEAVETGAEVAEEAASICRAVLEGSVCSVHTASVAWEAARELDLRGPEMEMLQMCPV